MITKLRHVITAGVIAIAFESSLVFAQTALTGGVTPPPVPPELQVPPGNTAFLKGHATGTQNYICLPSKSGFSWTFFSPQATLFLSIKWINGDLQQQITTHFLSPNPSEKNLPRATWQHSFDSSKVWGKSIASSSDPKFVEAGAIPWLLLQEAGTERGPSGGATLTQTTYIQRLNTSGGVAPAAGCSASTDVGASALVPYTADYFFSKKDTNPQ
jgi:hypothetical protein